MKLTLKDNQKLFRTSYRPKFECSEKLPGVSTQVTEKRF